MRLKNSTALALLALAVSLVTSCSSKEDRDKYDHYYGSGSKAREEASLVELQNNRRSQPVKLADSTAAAGQATGSTSKPSEVGSDSAGTPAVAAATVPAAAKPRKPVPAEVSALLNKHACFACHQAYDKVIGPAYSEVAKKKYSPDEIVALVHAPKPEHWPGYPPMAPLPHVPKADIVVIANWINSL